MHQVIAKFSEGSLRGPSALAEPQRPEPWRDASPAASLLVASAELDLHLVAQVPAPLLAAALAGVPPLILVV